MTKRSLTAVLFFVSWLALVPSADAQLFQRLFSPSRDEEVTRLPRGGNPEHERKKTEADKANQNGDFPKAIELTDEVLQQNPTDSVAYYLRASARVELGARQFDTKLVRDGVIDSREAIRNDKQRTAMYYLPYLHGMKSLAILENQPKHAETSVTVANQILGVPGISNEDKANLLYQRAQAYDVLGKIDPAVADMDEALKLMPTHFGARAAVAEMLAKAGRAPQATTAFNKLVESFPESPLSYNNRGMFLQRQGKLDDAVADFTRAIERDPNYFTSFTNRGFTLLQAGDAAAAEADFSQSLKLNPQQPFLYNLRGLSKLARGDVAGAIQDQRVAIEMNPKDAVARGDLGFLHFFAGDFSAALEEFDAAQAADPEFRHLNPWKIAALTRLGKAQNLKEQFAGSLAKNLLKRDWVDHLVAYLLGAETDADLLAACNPVSNSLKSDQTCEAYYFIALNRFAAGKTAEGLDACQRAVATKSRQLAAFRGAQFALKKANPTAAGSSVGVPAAGIPTANPAGR